METRKLIPYQVYLRPDQIARLKEMSVTRSASDFIRRSIDAMNNRPMDFDQGFNMGLEKAIEIVQRSHHGQVTFPGGESLSTMITRDIQSYVKP